MPTFVPCMTFDSLSFEFDGLVSCLREGHDSVLDKHEVHFRLSMIWCQSAIASHFFYRTFDSLFPQSGN
jgi:hypothetical protein